MKIISNIKKEIIAFLGVILTLALFVYTQRDINEIRSQERIDYYSLNNSILNIKYDIDSLRFYTLNGSLDSVELILPISLINTSNYNCELIGLIANISDEEDPNLYPLVSKLFVKNSITNKMEFLFYKNHFMIIPKDTLNLNMNYWVSFNQRKKNRSDYLHLMFVYQNGIGGYYSSYTVSPIFFDKFATNFDRTPGKIIPIQLLDFNIYYKTFLPYEFHKIQENFNKIIQFDTTRSHISSGSGYLLKEYK